MITSVCLVFRLVVLDVPNGPRRSEVIALILRALIVGTVFCFSTPMVSC